MRTQSFRWPQRFWEWLVFFSPALVMLASSLFAPGLVRHYRLGPPNWVSIEADCAMFGGWTALALCFALSLWLTDSRLPYLALLANGLLAFFLITFVNFSIAFAGCVAAEAGGNVFSQ